LPGFAPWGDQPNWGQWGPWGGPGLPTPGGSSYPPLSGVSLTGQSPPVLGVDIQCLYDLDPYFSVVSGPQCLAQDLAHRLQTPPGGLFYDPSYGYNVPGLLNGAITPQKLQTISAGIANQCQADERVQNAQVELEFDTDTETLTVNVIVTPVSGLTPFVFVLSVTQVSMQLLGVGPVS